VLTQSVRPGQVRPKRPVRKEDHVDLETIDVDNIRPGFFGEVPARALEIGFWSLVIA
jgi:hypothetical protein